MKPGDLVRIKMHTAPEESDCVKLGLLVVYQKWEKIATVLIDGKLRRYRAENVTRAGRQDHELIGGTL